MILLGELAFMVVIIMLIGGIAMAINTEIQKRLQIRDLIRNYTPEQIDLFMRLQKRMNKED